MQPQEATKEPMVELDTGGNAVDVELITEKAFQVFSHPSSPFSLPL